MTKKFQLDFIGIGVARCGTTWLVKCLNEHPKVSLPKERELAYFSTNPLWRTTTNHNRGEKWLKNCFTHSTVDQIKGEFTTTYISDPSSPGLIKERNPDAKFIISFRNPVDRLYSFYYMIKRLYPGTSTFEEFIECNKMYVESGFYYSQTLRFLNYFDKDKFFFIVYEDIVSEPDVVIKKLYDFLEVDSEFVPSCLHNKVNVSSGVKSTFVKNIMGNSAEFLKSSSLGLKFNGLLDSLGAHSIARWIHCKNLKAFKFPPMKESSRSSLIKIYSKENILLGNLINRDLTSWNDLTRPATNHQK
jgi:hypothetical protein